MPKKDKQTTADAKRKAAEAKSKAKHTEALRSLTPIAKEINSRFEKADQMEGKADDHRLAAALQLAKAKTIAEAAKVPFKKWCEDNLVGQSYENIRKLAVVGAADKPELALADMRGKNKVANQKARDAKKSGTSAGTTETGPATPKVTPQERILEGFDAITDEQALTMIRSKVSEFGFTMVATDDAEPDETGGDETAEDTFETMKGMFRAFDGAERMKFLNWAAEVVGVKMAEADPFDLGVHEQKTKGRRKKAA